MIARRVPLEERPFLVFIRREHQPVLELEGRCVGQVEAEDAASLQASRGIAVAAEVRQVLSRWEAGDV